MFHREKIFWAIKISACLGLICAMFLPLSTCPKTNSEVISREQARQLLQEQRGHEISNNELQATLRIGQVNISNECRIVVETADQLKKVCCCERIPLYVLDWLAGSASVHTLFDPKQAKSYQLFIIFLWPVLFMPFVFLLRQRTLARRILAGLELIACLLSGYWIFMLAFWGETLWGGYLALGAVIGYGAVCLYPLLAGLGRLWLTFRQRRR